MTNDATRATAEGLPNIPRALDILNHAWSMVELVSMAAEAGTLESEASNAIAYGCMNAQELLDQVKDHLKPRGPADGKGGEA